MKTIAIIKILIITICLFLVLNFINSNNIYSLNYLIGIKISPNISKHYNENINVFENDISADSEFTLNPWGIGIVNRLFLTKDMFLNLDILAIDRNIEYEAESSMGSDTITVVMETLDIPLTFNYKFTNDFSIGLGVLVSLPYKSYFHYENLFL